MAKSLLRIKAGELRRRGTSIKEISKILSVSTSTASRWCGDIFLTKEQSYKLELLRIEGQKRGRILASEVLRQRRLKRILFCGFGAIFSRRRQEKQEGYVY